MEDNNTCPFCRAVVASTRINGPFAELSADYLKANPDKQLPEEDIKERETRYKVGDTVSHYAKR